jgi:cell wall-associated NlpC family hydrolase
MGLRATLVVLMSAVAIGCGSKTDLRGPAPFPLANRPSAATSAPAAPPAIAAPGLDGVGALLDTALALRGTAYRLGGQDPDTGFDCSGLVRYVFAQHAIDVPRTVTEQFAAGTSIAQDDVRAGDLLFFSTTASGPTHVGIALGPLTPGEFVHAPGTGSAVRIERFETPYWRARFVGAKRVPMTSGVVLRKT